MYYLVEPGPALADRFSYLIGGLCHYLGMIFTRDRSTADLTGLIHARLKRLSARFAALVARVEAGTMLPVRARSKPHAARVASPGPMPSKFGWLCELMPEGNVFATYLEEQLRSDAKLATLLAKAPRAGRLIRPVLWMMGREVPEMLRLAERPRKAVVRPAPVEIATTPYREQPVGSHYSTAVWPTEAQLQRAGRKLAVASRRKISLD